MEFSRLKVHIRPDGIGLNTEVTVAKLQRYEYSLKRASEAHGETSSLKLQYGSWGDCDTSEGGAETFPSICLSLDYCIGLSAAGREITK